MKGPDDWARDRVLRFLSEASGRTPESISAHESLTAFEIDSLEEVEFIMELEDELQIEIPDPAPPLETVADLIALVRSARP